MYNSVLMGKGQSPLATTQQLNQQRPNATTPVQASSGQFQDSPANRSMQMPNLPGISNDGGSGNNNNHNNRTLAQMQQMSASAANLMATLQANASTIPRAATYAGVTLQNLKSMPPNMFDSLIKAVQLRKGIDISTRWVESQEVEPYHLFLVVCKFGGHAEVSEGESTRIVTDRKLTLATFRSRRKTSGA